MFNESIAKPGRIKFYVKIVCDMKSAAGNCGEPAIVGGNGGFPVQLLLSADNNEDINYVVGEGMEYKEYTESVEIGWGNSTNPEPCIKTCVFTDAVKDCYYGKAVLRAMENGITKGTDDTAFSPDVVALNLWRQCWPFLDIILKTQIIASD